MSDQKPTIISIGAGASQVPLILKAKELGYSVIAVDRNTESQGFASADEQLILSTHSSEEIIVALKKLVKEYRFQGVVARTSARQALQTATDIIKEFGLLGLTRDFVDIATQKSALRKFCFKHQLPMPVGFDTKGGLPSLKSSSFPLIVKPDSTIVGKKNIRLCRDASNFKTSISEAEEVSINKRAEVESYIEGIDATCLCWANKGKVSFLNWFDELSGIDSDGRLVGLGASIPSVISKTDVQKEAEKIIAELVGEFPELVTLFFISFRITMRGEPHIIEIHADLGGDLIPDLLFPKANPDFDFFKLAIEVGKLKPAKRILFEPTLLFYSHSESTIFQESSVEENLKKLPEMLESKNICSSVLPLHLKWLEKNGLS